MEPKIDPEKRPDWQSQSPEGIIEEIRLWHDKIRESRRKALEDLVFEFSDHVDVGNAYVVPGTAFHDGQQRVFLNSTHRTAVDELKAAALSV